jgi:eukaryotic-like serine/threonine-protein kinase
VATPRITDSVGRVLGDRYRLTRPLGVGASAHVYVAEDVSLRRRVAIKVLHPALAGDAAFGRRFRAEAQVVAALRHPNILRVYDWGDDGDAPYLVMELLEGGSLRALLDRGGLLSPAQAAGVGADVARALDYAHRRGLVHRDIKPANLIFDDEGRIAVADFGLARALAEASWTEPVGAVVGTARYAAPEQVRGEYLDSRADVYALALVLIEATTGSVPFAADTTLATLMARMARPLTTPADIGPLGPVLEAAGTVDPGDRLDAAGLARRLDGVAARLPPPAPLLLAGPIEREVEEGDVDPTEHPGRSRLFDGDLDEDLDEAFGDEGDRPTGQAGGLPGGPPGVKPDGPEAVVVGPGLATARPDRTAARPDPTAARPDPDPRVAAVDGTRRGRRRWLRRGALAAIAVLVIGVVAVALAATGRFTPSHPVPSLVGSSQAAAEARLLPLHLHLSVFGHAYEAHAAVGTIVSQRPDGGRLREGATVAVSLSLGPPPVRVPHLAGLSSGSAVSLLQYLGLKTAVSHAASMTVPAGVVIQSSPDGGTLLPGQAVAMVVSTGKPTVAIPVLTGASAASFDAAQTALSGLHLAATADYEYTDTVPSGAVIGTDPAAGAVAIVGTNVTVVVSKGPHLVAVPDVKGDSVGTATQTLTSAGFGVSGVTGNPIATVTATSPPAATVVRYGASVQIVTG